MLKYRTLSTRQVEAYRPIRPCRYRRPWLELWDFRHDVMLCRRYQSVTCAACPPSSASMLARSWFPWQTCLNVQDASWLVHAQHVSHCRCHCIASLVYPRRRSMVDMSCCPGWLMARGAHRSWLPCCCTKCGSLGALPLRTVRDGMSQAYPIVCCCDYGDAW